ASEGPPRWLHPGCSEVLMDNAICQAAIRLGKRVGSWREPDGDGAWTFVVADNGAFYGVYWSAHRRLGFKVPAHPQTQKLLAAADKYQLYRSDLEQQLSEIPDKFAEHHQQWQQSSVESRIDAAEFLKDDLNDIRVKTAAKLDGYNRQSE